MAIKAAIIVCSDTISNGKKEDIAGKTIIGKLKETNVNVIDYITFSTPGNAVDFGDLTVGRGYIGSCSNGTRGVWGGGKYTNGGGSSVTRID